MEYGEKFNTCTHLLGAVLALTGSAVLIATAVAGKDTLKIVGFTIYSTTLVLLYGFSTLYHNAKSGRNKDVLVKLDHLSIYLLIAGTYTPFAVVSLRGLWGWSMLGLIYGLAATGIWQELRSNKKPQKVSLVLYILTGWIAVVAVLPLLETLSWAAFIWIAAGGLAYTAGIFFYHFDQKFAHWHGIWHLFVLAGSTLHYCAILLYVA